MSVTEHSFLKLLWIREGRAKIEFKSESPDCETGNLVIVPPCTPHRIVDSLDAPVSLFGLGLDTKQLACVEPVLPTFQTGSIRIVLMLRIGLNFIKKDII